MEKNKQKSKSNQSGITLIALVITIIVLLILAAISIATLTGENGVLTKADVASKNTDIVETKEQIKIELMGTLDDQKTDYTDEDVKNAVKKITGKDVEQDVATVLSKKGNIVDISDLWIKKIKFTIQLDPRESPKELYVVDGTSWVDLYEDHGKGVVTWEVMGEFLELAYSYQRHNIVNENAPVYFAQYGESHWLTYSKGEVCFRDKILEGENYKDGAYKYIE